MARKRSSVSVSSIFPFSFERILFNIKFEEKLAMRFRYFRIKMVTELISQMTVKLVTNNIANKYGLIVDNRILSSISHCSSFNLVHTATSLKTFPELASLYIFSFLYIGCSCHQVFECNCLII